MGSRQQWGNVLLGIAMTGFGIAQFATQHFLQGLLPFGELPLYKVWVNATALLFLITGILLILQKQLRYATAAAGILFFLFFLYPHLVKLLADPHNGSTWAGALECLSLSSGAFLTGISQQLYSNRLPAWMSIATRYVFALCLLLFGSQHFLYATYIATLIPAWVPFSLFWAYFVGIAFIATAISLFSGMLTRLSCTLLAILFFTWVLILHSPRVFASPAIEPEWTSLFVALAMGAIALQISHLCIKRPVEERSEKGKKYTIQA